METAQFERFELELPSDCVSDCSHSGPCDTDVARWAPKIERPPEITAELLAAELKEFGAWDETELADDSANWRRLIWLAAGQVKETLAAAPYHNLDELLRSQAFEYFESDRLGNNLFLSDPERADRIHAAAGDGCDGSTHAEHIEDWRDFLNCEERDGNVPASIAARIRAQIDDCEAWHEKNGSLAQAGG